VWITKRTDYATRAVLALALVDADKPVKLGELARRTAVPRSVLEQVMPALRSAGVVRSEHGARGGYRLNKAPSEITLEQVVRIFQGPLAPIACATRRNPEPCPMSIECSLRFIWQDVRDATITLLSKTTFANLADRAGGAWREWEQKDQ
jgi:Rrf2 family protein